MITLNHARRHELLYKSVSRYSLCCIASAVIFIKWHSRQLAFFQIALAIWNHDSWLYCWKTTQVYSSCLYSLLNIKSKASFKAMLFVLFWDLLVWSWCQAWWCSFWSALHRKDPANNYSCSRCAALRSSTYDVVDYTFYSWLFWFHPSFLCFPQPSLQDLG